MTTTSRTITPADDQWRSLRQRLVRLAAIVTGDGRTASARVEDLAQETIARLLRARQSPSEYAYARRTLLHLYLDEERSARRRLRRHMTFFRMHPRLELPDPDRADEREQVALARRTLDRLSPLQRAAFALRVIEEMSYEEIGHALGATPAAARTSVHVARKKLAHAIGGTPS